MRENAGYSQYSFAEAFGVAQSTVGNWESGKREPSFDTMQRLADFFEVTVDCLLGREDIKKGSAEAKPHEPGKFGDLRFALSGEVKDLTDNEFEEIMDFIHFIEQKRKRR